MTHLIDDSPRLVSDLRDDERAGVDSGIRMNGEALEADLFEQMMR